jgi:hypothetical protein
VSSREKIVQVASLGSLERRIAMKPTRARLAGIAAALTTVAIAAPMSSASAAAVPPAVDPLGIAGDWWGGTAGVPWTAIEPVGGFAVVGPVIITTAPSSFNNTNNQVAAGDNWSGGQVSP